jgi:hypothetical protein
VKAGALAAAAVLAVAAGCAGGGADAAGSTGGGSGPPPRVTVLPTSGTVSYTDGRVYTIAPRGTTLTLRDIAVRVVSLHWAAAVPGAVHLPGTKTYALLTLTVTNRSRVPQVLGATQMWLLDAQNHAYLASPRARAGRSLLGPVLAPGAAVTGTLVFPTPGRISGNLLVYAFADAAAIARAHHVGLLAYG